MIPSPIVSLLEHDPRPGRGGDAERAAEGGAERCAGRGDLVLGLEGADAERLWRASSSRIELSGVIGYAPRKRSSPDSFEAAIRPYASAELPVICR